MHVIVQLQWKKIWLGFSMTKKMHNLLTWVYVDISFCSLSSAFNFNLKGTFFLYSFPYNYFSLTDFLILNMSTYFHTLKVHVKVVKLFDVVKGRRFLIHAKSPLAFKEGDLIFFLKERHLNDLSERCLSTIFLIYEESHRF